jgi:hypothetical protein
MRRVPRTTGIEQPIASSSFTTTRLWTLFHHIARAEWTRLTCVLTYAVYSLRPRRLVRRRTQLVAALDPHSLQLALDFRAAAFPLFDLGEALAQLSEFFLDGGFLRRGPDACELPFLA